mmetsp:Transcript_130333/g.291586  ORF Transcript_130333/g.291586 Transcript_130333/m.291586 type:complete len:293 (+) Transcript_130333:524-1402(+)
MGPRWWLHCPCWLPCLRQDLIRHLAHRCNSALRRHCCSRSSNASRRKPELRCSGGRPCRPSGCSRCTCNRNTTGRASRLRRQALFCEPCRPALLWCCRRLLSSPWRCRSGRVEGAFRQSPLRLWLHCWLHCGAEDATGRRNAVQQAGPDVCTHEALTAPVAGGHQGNLTDRLSVAVVNIDLHCLPCAQLHYLDELVHVTEHHLCGAEQIVLVGDKSRFLRRRLWEHLQNSDPLVIRILETVVAHYCTQESGTAPPPRHNIHISGRVVTNVVHDKLGPRVLRLLNELEERPLV